MARYGLAVILTLYLGLAAAFAAVMPFGKAPDETAHALYVQHLAEKHSLPVLTKRLRVAYEYHQPPLYYLLAAPAWAAAARTTGELGGAPAQMARAVSILIGALGVCLIAALARALWPGQEALALTAAGFAALLPMRLATAASVSNDTLAEAIFTAGLLVMVRMLRNGAEPRRAALLGGCLGLGVLSKSSDLLLFPVALIALLLACQSPGDGRQTGDGNPSAPAGKAAPAAPPPAQPSFDAARFLRCTAVTFGIALLIGAGWMARNARLYGDPLGTRAFEQYFQDTWTPDRLADTLGYSRLELLERKVLPLTFCSFWGVFGHMNVFMGAYPRGSDPPAWAFFLADRGYPPPSWVYPLLLLLTLAVAAGLAKVGVRYSVFGIRAGPSQHRTPNTEHRTPEHLLLALAAFLVLSAFLRFNTEFFQAQGRYLFPALGPIALAFAGGWLAWWPERRRILGGAALLVLLLALALFALIGTVAPAFRP
jgi:4-amino-4-deoxy-L-arabinose transferase-like glycosyltransferase